MAAAHNNLETFLKDVGDQIRKFRKDQNWSLEELGLRIGIVRSDIHDIEAGKRNLTLRTLLKLAVAFDKKPSDFFEFPINIQSYELGSLSRPEKVLSKPKSKKKVAKKSTSSKRKAGSDRK